MTADRPETLDVRGFPCPQPIIDLSRRIGQLTAGAALIVLSDDPAFPLDLEAWCAGCGHDLLELKSEGRLHRALVRKAGP